MVTERELMITSFLKKQTRPETIGEQDEGRYWQLAGEAIDKALTRAGVETPIFGMADGEPALLGFGDRGPVMFTVDQDDGLVTHQIRGADSRVTIRDVSPIVADVGLTSSYRIEVEVLGLPSPFVVTGFSLDDLAPRRAAILDSLG